MLKSFAEAVSVDGDYKEYLDKIDETIPKLINLHDQEFAESCLENLEGIKKTALQGNSMSGRQMEAIDNIIESVEQGLSFSRHDEDDFFKVF